MLIERSCALIIQHTNFGAKNIVRCGIHTGTHDYGTHIHQFSELVYVLEGEIESTVEDKTDLLCAGQMAIITPLKPHSTYTPEYCKIVICVFSNDFVTDFLPESELYNGYSRAYFTPTDALNGLLRSRFIDAALKYTLKPITEDYRTVKACLHVIFDEYTRYTPPTPCSAKRELLADILFYLKDHFKENVTLASLGKALGYSPGYLSHYLECLPNMSFPSLLNSMRIEYAKGLLLNKNFKNIDIALECGFSCERSFYRAFSKLTGVSPQKYVQSINSKPQQTNN